MKNESGRLVSRVGGLIATALALPLVLGAPALSAQPVGSTVVRRGAVGDDLYAAGGKVILDVEVNGDVVAAGGRVDAGRVIRGDAMVAGGDVTLTGSVADDARLAGGLVTVDARIGDDLVAAGGQVTLTDRARVGGRAWLAGGSVDVAARLERSLTVAAGTVRIAGQVGGDVTLVARDVRILPGARIQGNLTYRSPRPATIDPAARVAGTVTHHPVPAPAIDRVARLAFWIGGALFLAGTALAGIVAVLLFPGFMVSAARTVRSDPGKSLGVGFALAVATPVAAALLAATIVGLPLGAALVALYGVWLLAGLVTAGLAVGELPVGRGRRSATRGWATVAVLLGVVVLAVLAAIPYAGAVILPLALLFGAGGWAVNAWRDYQRSD